MTTDASSGPVQAQTSRAGSVLIVGVGAVGGALAWQLARLGIRLRLIDKGVLGSTNLVWHQAGTEDLGQPKAVVLADHIRQRLPQCPVDGFEADFIELDVHAVQEHLAWADVVVAATDDVQVQGCINRDCLAAGKPTVFPAVWVDEVSHESEAGEILWVNPRHSVMPCYECLTLARNLALAAQPGERGGYINVEALSLTLVTVVTGLINPIDPAARFLWVERSLVRVRGHEPLRPTLVHDFGEGQYVSPVDVRFPPQPCPACGQQAQPDSPPEPPDTVPVGEPPGGEAPHPEWSIPPLAYAHNPPDYQGVNHPTDRRAFAAAAVTVIVLVALVIVWAVTSAVNRHHAAAAPSGPISPTIKLVCDPHVGGTWCEDGASGSAGTIALDIVGVSYDNFYNLCSMGYKFDLTDNYGQSSGVTGNGCGGYGDAYSTSANPVTGAPYVDLRLPKYSNTDNYRCGPWTLTLRIKDPSGHTIRTARYGTNLGNCSASPSPSTGATSAPSTRAKPASVRVPADAEGGVNTGIYARKGDTVVITGSGSAGYGYDGTEGCVGNPTTHPDGSRYLASFSCGPKDDPEAVLSGAAIGQLIARIGDGVWFGVGIRTTITAGGSGYIYLAYNDSAYSDNTGSYSASITNKGTGPLASP